jgi:beta-xylosidase
VGPRDRRYGLLRANGQPKPVYFALQRFLSVCGPRLEPGTPMKLEGGMPAGLVSISWKRPDGRQVWMAWAHEAMSVRLPGVKSGVWHQPIKGTQRDVAAADGKGPVLDIGTDLQMLVWN